MSREDTEARIRTLMKNYAMLGGERSISFSQPIGEQGLGLDSLAVIEFAVAFEKHFKVELPDDFWSGRPQLTLGHFADFVEQSQSGGTHATAGARSKVEEIEASGLRKLCSRMVRVVYDKQEYYILKYDLLKRDVSPVSASVELKFGELSPSDEQDFGELWDHKERDRKLARFRQRLDAGYIGFGAWDHGRLVGVDWITSDGDHEPWLGVEIRMVSGGCYGVDLQEHPDYRHKGVGMAILAFSLMESRKRGYNSQFTIVSPANKRMLTAAIQLFGFEKIGGLKTILLLKRATSTLELGGISRKVKTVDL